MPQFNFKGLKELGPLSIQVVLAIPKLERFFNPQLCGVSVKPSTGPRAGQKVAGKLGVSTEQLRPVGCICLL